MQPAWTAVEAEADRLKSQTLRDLFAADPARFDHFSARSNDMLLDFSREKIDAGALSALLALAEAAGVADARDRIFAGEPWNLTEGRAVLHMALRGSADAPDGADVAGTLDRFLAFAESVRSGAYGTANGPFTDVVNLGIGGSDLGPAMATQALAPDHDGPRVHFVSNVDGAHIGDTLAQLDPARTLVIIASKSFTTTETMMNARAARTWLEASLGDGAGAHMAAVSTNLTATAAFGIDETRVFGFWDWVGGRYSVWSAIGLPVAIAVGASGFRDFLAGAAEMDRHFRETAPERNLPILLALLGIWRRNAMGCASMALLPYDQRLARFPAFVQQLDMESNGKQVTRDGTAVPRSTGPVIWGAAGSDAQHSFFQLLHQGTDVVPVDFLCAARPRAADPAHHRVLLANMLAQAGALAFGRSQDESAAAMEADGLPADDVARLAAHRTYPGDRPSTILLYDALTPAALGRLIALYEHKVLVQGVIWGVNSFDQWGVELGKTLAAQLLPALEGADIAGLDPSATALIGEIRRREGGNGG